MSAEDDARLRERILAYLARGWTARMIAGALGCDVDTVVAVEREGGR